MKNKKMFIAMSIAMVGLVALSGCAQFKEAWNSATSDVKDHVLAAPDYVVAAIKALLGFLGNVLAAGWDTFVHKILPF